MEGEAQLPCSSEAIQSHGYHGYYGHHHNITTVPRLEKHAAPFWASLLAAWSKERRGGSEEGRQGGREGGRVEVKGQEVVRGMLEVTGTLVCRCSSSVDQRPHSNIQYTYFHTHISSFPFSSFSHKLHIKKS